MKKEITWNPHLFGENLKQTRIYHSDEIKEIIDLYIPDDVLISTNKKIDYFDIPCGFDIETSSFYENDSKRACMYEWTFGINGLIIIGRTWQEFTEMMNTIAKYMELSKKCRLIVFVHNLSYEFQFMRKHFEWENVFSISDRKPIYALTSNGIEFRCSYLLSGYSLMMLGKNLNKYHVEKLMGYLDYKKIRHSKTILTDDEIAYCVNDVKVVMAYVQEKIENEGNITKLPITKTGYVRNYCKRICFYDGLPRSKSIKYKSYVKLMQFLTLDQEEYKQLKRAFQGGFTHANPFYSGKIMKNVGSIDFTSSYPAVLVSEKFPMSKAELIEIKSVEDLRYNLRYFCCLFDVTFTNLVPEVLYDNYISSSRAWNVENMILNNGRVVSADKISLTVTEQDWAIIRRFYKWDRVKITNFRRYRKNYLPTDLVKSILKLYEDKTTLKGLEDTESIIKYQLSKELVNSVYGCMVTDVIRALITYEDGEWGRAEADVNKELMKYNKSKNRFLFYPWGVWCTAYARRNLFSGIMQFKDDYIYADTDSIKGLNFEKHQKYIDSYNKFIRSKLYRAMDFHNLPHESVEPKTVKGVPKCLGVWDFEGIYDRFKTLGAKRYMVEKDGKLNITVSGLNKKTVVPYLQENFSDPFEHFNEELYIPAEYTGKNTHTYIDDEIGGEITDYQGNKWYYHELSCIHLSESDYDLSISRLYAEYLLSLRQERI